MADVLVLLSSPSALERVRRAVAMDAAGRIRHSLRPCRGWGELTAEGAASPLCVALVDPYHGGTLAAGEIRRLRERVPLMEVLAYADFSGRPASDAFALAQLGVRAVMSLGADDTPAALRECIAAHVNATALDALVRRVGEAVPPRVASWLVPALRSPTTPSSAVGLARVARCSPRTLRRALCASGLPPAGELLAWRRLLHAARLMEDCHRSVDGVARALGCCDGSALRKCLRTLTGLRPAELIARGGLHLLADLFLERCGLERPERRPAVRSAPSHLAATMHAAPHAPEMAAADTEPPPLAAQIGWAGDAPRCTARAAPRPGRAAA
jgi:hypothetical protein